jgi:hypothetical protein
VAVTLLQGQLIKQLRTAASLEDWLARSPVGLDLEHCVHDSMLRNAFLEIHRLPERLLIILQDTRTAVASENTCAGIVVAVAPRLPLAAPTELLRSVRWRWLSPSYLPLVRHALPEADQRYMEAVLRADKELQGSLLQSIGDGSSCLRHTALLVQRPMSRLARLVMQGDYDAAQLGRSFDGERQTVSTTPWQVFAGLRWGMRLTWVRSQDDQALWGLGLAVVVNTFRPGAKLEPHCMLGGEFEVLVAGKVVHRGTHTWWPVPQPHVGSVHMLCDDVLGQKLSSWPAAAAELPASIEDGKLAVRLVVEKVV